MSGSESSPVTNSPCSVCGKVMAHINEVLEVNKRWKQEYDLLKAKYLREKSELERDNLRLKQEVTRLTETVADVDLCTTGCTKVRAENVSEENGNVDQLIKEQLDAYKEDFKLEHEDKEKIESERKSLQERLLQCERHVHILNQELEMYKKECKRLKERQDRSLVELKRHPVDRSKSYPETSSLSYKEDTLDPMATIAIPPSMCGKRDGYLSLRDFRHEQLKRGIRVRNLSQSRPPLPPTVNFVTSRRLSDSSSPSPSSPSIAQSHGRTNSGRTSCLW